MLQAGFEPGTYGILSTLIWDSALDHSATTAGSLETFWLTMTSLTENSNRLTYSSVQKWTKWERNNPMETTSGALRISLI